MTKDADKLSSIHFGKTSNLRLKVWSMRKKLKESLRGKDILDVETQGNISGKIVRKAYRTIDGFMNKFFPGLVKSTPKTVAMQRLKDMIEELDYTIVDKDETKPWGAFYRLSNDEAERFIKEFFPGLSVHEAKLGHDDVELSPKFLLVLPGQRLSWQYHDRRAERWRYLTNGAYYGSMTDDQGERVVMSAGEVIQFEKGERHRLCAFDDESYTLVAEIWQHTDPKHLSEEADIVRLQDDYKR